jgi:hypothetical protein
MWGGGNRVEMFVKCRSIPTFVDRAKQSATNTMANSTSLLLAGERAWLESSEAWEGLPTEAFT